MKVLITGGLGKCGSALLNIPHEKVFLDRLDCPEAFRDQQFVQGDVGDSKLLVEAMEGCDAVVHLAYAWPDTLRNWEEVVALDTENTRQLLKIASYLKVERVICASSNHIVGMYEVENAPHLYEPNFGLKVDKDAPVRPDSLYGISKAFGEIFGRFYAENGGPKFYAVRIGAVLGSGHDHPYAYAEEGVRTGQWKRASDLYRYKEKRLKSLWQSRRDFAQLIDLCLRYEGPVFDVFYGVSNNATRWLDIEYAKEALGYKPQDNATEWICPPEPTQKVAEPIGTTE